NPSTSAKSMNSTTVTRCCPLSTSDIQDVARPSRAATSRWLSSAMCRRSLSNRRIASCLGDLSCSLMPCVWRYLQGNAKGDIPTRIGNFDPILGVVMLWVALTAIGSMIAGFFLGIAVFLMVLIETAGRKEEVKKPSQPKQDGLKVSAKLHTILDDE